MEVYKNDIPQAILETIKKCKMVACDIETTGLNWEIEKIGTCQLHTDNGITVIVRMGNEKPLNLISILQDETIIKVFHHAMFDLRFMTYYWGINVQNINCTKIASKLIDPGNESNHSLKTILEKYLNIIITKEQQQSDWLTEKLSTDQIKYATNDVTYLIPLLLRLREVLGAKGLEKLADSCFEHIPTRVQLDVMKYQDVYSY